MVLIAGAIPGRGTGRPTLPACLDVISNFTITYWPLDGLNFIVTAELMRSSRVVRSCSRGRRGVSTVFMCGRGPNKKSPQVGQSGNLLDAE